MMDVSTIGHKELTYIKQFPAIEHINFMECIGNYDAELLETNLSTAQLLPYLDVLHLFHYML